MEEYNVRLEHIFDAHPVDLTRTLRDIHSIYVIDPEDEDPGFFDEFTTAIDDARLKHADDDFAQATEVTSDPYVGMEMAMLRGAEGKFVHATLRKQVRGDDGTPVRVAHDNPLLDSRKSEVEYVDGHVEELTANLIAENLIARVDEEGRRQMMLSALIDHRASNDAVPQSQGTYVNPYEVKQRKITAR